MDTIITVSEELRKSFYESSTAQKQLPIYFVRCRIQNAASIPRYRRYCCCEVDMTLNVIDSPAETEHSVKTANLPFAVRWSTYSE